MTAIITERDGARLYISPSRIGGWMANDARKRREMRECAGFDGIDLAHKSNTPASGGMELYLSYCAPTR